MAHHYQWQITGIPVNLNNDKEIVKYLEEFEIENIDIIPEIQAVSKLGWRNGYFVPLQKDCPYLIDYKIPKWEKAYSTKGTLEEWIKKIKPYRKNKIFRFILSASFASPLLEIIGHRIFVVFNWGNSRGGKSACLKCALSVYGNPEDLTLTFNTTAVGIERLAGLFNDLPLGIDEKQVNKSQNDLEKIIYMLGNGISKIRGNKAGGVQAINTWKTIVLATGEEPISNSNSNTGIHTRCLEIEGSPFDENEKKASEVYHIINEQYGTAGPYYINKLIEEHKGNEYKDLKLKFKEIQENLENKSCNDILSYVSAVSIVTLADILIGKWLFNEEEQTSYEMAKQILNNLDKSSEIDEVEKIYKYIISWLIGNYNGFDKYKNNRYEVQENGIQKRRDEELINDRNRQRTFGIYDEKEKAFYVHTYIIKDKLEHMGKSYRKMLQEWGKRGYIEVKKDTDGNIISTSIQKKYQKVNTRFIVFPVDKMDDDLIDGVRVEEIEKLQEYKSEEENVNMEITTKLEDVFKNVNNTEDKELEEIRKEAEFIEEVNNLE